MSYTPPKNPRHSYSSTDKFNTCQVAYQKINWLKTYRSESGAAAIRGTQMHEEYEQCVLDDTDYSIADYQWVLDDFRAQTGLKIPEMQLAIDSHWEPTPYDLGKDEEGKTIPNPDAFYCGIIDFTCINGTHANVDDLKTGKRKMKDPKPYETWLLDRHEDGMKEAPKMLANARQASEYTLLIFHHFPKIETIDFRFIWSDVEGITEDVYHFDKERDSLNLHETMLATPTKIQHAIENDEWVPNPSGLCRQYCEVETCKYHGKYWSEIKKMLAKEKK